MRVGNLIRHFSGWLSRWTRSLNQEIGSRRVLDVPSFHQGHLLWQKNEPLCTESHREGRQGHSLCAPSLDSVPLLTKSTGLMGHS